ncbi:dorsalin-1-like isoform X2 [Zootermopsis nevadensis]|uniref:dorsalin-1-like isoform X2 n=1 Tax=Zootermopsis nevadensis TaxID=136037 RepID=UPI000B8E7AE5|nr:dorsalin-1-like isoform X2 [Zootermopsis nevadensis]
MWWQSSVVLALTSLTFCTWLWIVHLPQTNTQDVITTNVQVSVIGETVAYSKISNISTKHLVKSTSKPFGMSDVFKRKQRHIVPRFMLDLYEKATASRHSSSIGSGRFAPDVVRGLTPRTAASVLEPGGNLKVPAEDRRHLLVFDVPSSSYGETLQSAELRLLLTTTSQYQDILSSDEDTGLERLVHIYMLTEQATLLELDVRHVFQRHGVTWLSFNVTAAVRRLIPRILLRLLVHIRATSPHSQLDLALVVSPHDGPQFQDQDVQPLLLLSYSALTGAPPRRTRGKRDTEDYEEESNNIWDDDRTAVATGLQARRTKRQRNTCRRRPLYVDFSEIHYDTWIVAPNGYEASVAVDTG